MEIRQATPADFPRIRDLDLGPEMTTERDTIYAIFFRLFPELCMVGEEDGELVGFVLGALSSDGRESYLHDLWVRPEMRGLGHGSRLMERYLEVSRALGAARVSLVARGAVPYYERKFGFVRATGADDPYVPELERYRGFSVLVLDLGASPGAVLD